MRNAVNHIADLAGPRLEADREAMHAASRLWTAALTADGARFEGDKSTADLLAMTFMAGWFAGRGADPWQEIHPCPACGRENVLHCWRCKPEACRD